jgi:hypothetical protein
MRIGQTILVGFTYYSQDGDVTEQEQLFGKIAEIDQESIRVKYTNGEEWFIPAYALDAPRGTYECVRSGEKVTNPDFLASWIIRDAADPDSPPMWRPNYAPLFMSEVPKEFVHTYDHDREFIESLIDVKGEDYLGKTVIIGLTYYREVHGEQELVEQRQVHGRIARVSYGEGVIIESENDTEYKLPPDLSLLEPAPPGEYEERSTGEVISNPDFITMWTVVLAQKEESI